MLCNEFKCVDLVDGECDQLETECIGNLCENWGECINCQQLVQEECEGIRSR